MSKFADWFNRQYKRWVRSQPGEEDFLGFCSLLGYPPATVLDWLEGEATPQGLQVLSIAGLFGLKVYQILGLPEPDTELMDLYKSTSNMPGELKSRASNALWEATEQLKERQIKADSEEGKAIIKQAFDKWGFNFKGDLGHQE